MTPTIRAIRLTPSNDRNGMQRQASRKFFINEVI
ncbi:unnamed protein product [Schistosoma mattheei]|uniref:Uncharacterized protein n=1 Tax=Schistosoma mattheei TaxID=31246 RepID=A0A3P8I8C4_9TREM|nr:unnamed protein product [Schistosoma mattheei]